VAALDDTNYSSVSFQIDGLDLAEPRLPLLLVDWSQVYLSSVALPGYSPEK